jgi:triosephosphate isomerase
MKKLIVANWKMNPKTLPEARKLVSGLEHRMHTVSEHTQVAVCAPFVFLAPLSHHLHNVKLGAQNLSWATEGALTGEISALQLKHYKVEYVILGHSERRLYLGETDSMVREKIKTSLEQKITPIVCLGGEEHARENEMKSVVSRQFTGVTKDLSREQLENIIYVYEPVWSISTMENSKPASGEHALELIEHIYKLLEDRIGVVAKNIRVLYGGTVNKHNVAQYARYPLIDGALVGSASLDPENFWKIIKEFNRESIHRG